MRGNIMETVTDKVRDHRLPARRPVPYLVPPAYPPSGTQVLGQRRHRSPAAARDYPLYKVRGLILDSDGTQILDG